MNTGRAEQRATCDQGTNDVSYLEVDMILRRSSPVSAFHELSVNTADDHAEAAARREAMVRELHAVGELNSDAVARASGVVPRHVFAPRNLERRRHARHRRPSEPRTLQAMSKAAPPDSIRNHVTRSSSTPPSASLASGQIRWNILTVT